MMMKINTPKAVLLPASALRFIFSFATSALCKCVLDRRASRQENHVEQTERKIDNKWTDAV